MSFRDVIGILIIVGIVAWIVWAVIVERKSRKKAEEFFNSIKIEGDRILLPGRKKVKRGRIRLQGEWRYNTKGGRYYNVSKEFKEEEEFETDFIRLKPSEFKIIMSKDETILLEAEAYLIGDNALIPIIPSYDISLEKNTLEVSWNGDFASATLRVEDGISGVVGGNFSKTRGVKVELKSREPKVKVKLFEGKEGKFKYEPLKDSPILVTTIKAPRLRKLGELGKPFIYGHGEFELSLILDVPFRRDVIDSAKVLIKPNSQIEGRIRKVLL
ncbi:hypothetical protein PNA2_0275 [Pyrococcus sp. NA2]|uniref:hypothetical protein n=1 Tax=Pyrococcus sp. (strain NA2) TaxID=342949 RepID=UPI000209B02C|nr:hypothetical protein [Pyrococcus sp. NA2]AEC51193.1 hypothetical protein PNA2_0275 [Pyrococcus sp. NA2]